MLFGWINRLELSQKDWLNYVVPYKILDEEELLKHSLYIMDVVVKNPVRLHNSSFQKDIENVLETNTGSSR